MRSIEPFSARQSSNRYRCESSSIQSLTSSGIGAMSDERDAGLSHRLRGPQPLPSGELQVQADEVARCRLISYQG
jgi:hypothetical protein